MLYGELHIIGKDLKAYIADLLEEKIGLSGEKSQEVIESFSHVRKHVSPKEFFCFLKENNIDIGEKQIQKIFQILTEIGFLSELSFEGEDEKRYEFLRPRDHHDHFICMKCKRIIEFTSAQLERLQDSLVFEKGCRPFYHKLEVYGICPECHSSSRREVSIMFIPQGQGVIVSRIDGGQCFRKRLSDLGFVPKAAVKVVKNSHFGPLVLELKKSRLAIGRGEAQHIFVFEK